MYQVGDKFQQVFTVRGIVSTGEVPGENDFFVCQTTLAPGNRWSMNCPVRKDFIIGDRFAITFSVTAVKPDSGRIECTFKDYSGVDHWISFEAENKPVVVESEYTKEGA